jgi:dihydrofolate reductase
MTAAAPVALVVAMADNAVIGRNGTLPWHLPDDLKHFKAVTLGKPVLMGRRTFQSIGKPLPGRRNLVLSRGERSAAAPPGIEYVASIEEARERVSSAVQLCVIGGAQVYALALPIATLIYLTRVHAVIEGDTHFPLPDGGGAGAADGGGWPGWHELERTEHPADARHAYAMSFVTLQRAAADSEGEEP